MLKCDNMEYLRKVQAFARKMGLQKQLAEQLRYLHKYAGKNVTLCKLFKDFSPNSFEFTMFRRRAGGEECWFNGGLIYFGPGDTGVGGPQYSVRFGEGNDAGWSIHI